MRALLRFFRLLPAALDLAWLRWARAHLSKHNPLHPDIPYILRRIEELKEKARA